jgi:hypothetical protein
MDTTNEPVAWAIKADNDFTEIGFDNQLLEEIEQMYVMEGWKYEVIPLYTHPVKDKPHPKCDEACMYLCQMRELTDEEIIAVGNAVVNHIDSNEGWIEFARAILRKAQEK